MNLAILSMDGLLFVLRWFHIFFGVIWIGLLYYFNFVQGPFFNETDAPTKSNAIQKLVPRALWWFRWGAMFTLIMGLVIFSIRGHEGKMAYLTSYAGVNISIGMILGIIMWANVWFVIWPNQKLVIQSATQAALGQPALPNAAAAAAKAGLASRHNVLFSIPMLFFMSGARHLPIGITPESNFTAIFGIILAIVALLELNALKGKMGPLTKIGGVIHMGFILTIVLYLTVEFFK